MYDFRINFNEEKEAIELLESLKADIKGLRDELALEYVKGYLTALENYWDKYQNGYTNMQIMYIGYYIYRYIAERKGC